MASACRGLAFRLRNFAAALSVAAFSACASSPAPPAPAARPPPPAVATETPDPSYDWHVLILVPFGTLFKESPIGLHDVMQFQDMGAAQPAAGHAPSSGTEDKDCYGIGVAPPQFVGHRPDEYLLCFDHDRLSRIEATVRLPAQTAGSIFAAACAKWRTAGATVAETSGSCDGRDGAAGFSAHLSGESALSISLFSVAAP